MKLCLLYWTAGVYFLGQGMADLRHDMCNVNYVCAEPHPQ